MNHIIDELVHAGLSKKEASVYLSALQLGRVNANTIAKRCSIPRATTYVVLRDLEKKGLVTVSAQKNEHVYQAAHPDRIENLLEVKKMDIESRIVSAKKMKSKLLALYNEDEKKLKIRYFEGIEGMHRLREELSVFKGDILQIIGYDAFMLLQDPAKTKEYRAKHTNETQMARSILITEKQVEVPGFEIVCIPKEVAPVEGEMTVLDDRLILFSYVGDIMAIEITSKPIADTARASLEFAWQFVKQKEKPSDKDRKG